MTQTASNSANSLNVCKALPTPVCVTAFIAPQSIIELSLNADGSREISSAPAILSVGTYMSDRSIWHICNFTNAANALNYAFLLKKENCPISKNAFALIQSEIKRTNAVSSRAKAKAEKSKEEEKTAEVTQDNQTPKISSIDEQYIEMKKKHPDALLLFRVGDFYEIFNEDAKIASDVLDITLTYRTHKDKKTMLAGFPHHALDTYLPKLVRAGHRVAICEELEKPKKKKASKK